MRYSILSFILLISWYGHTAPKQKDFEGLIHNYLDSLLEEDEKKLKSIVSKQYYQELKDSKTLDYIYQQYRKNKPDKKQRSIDIKVKKGLVDKDYFYVNVKDSAKKDYDSNWFVVKENDAKKLYIDSVVDFNETSQ